jgi:hypothetical protein
MVWAARNGIAKAGSLSGGRPASTPWTFPRQPSPFPWHPTPPAKALPHPARSLAKAPCPIRWRERRKARGRGNLSEEGWVTQRVKVWCCPRTCVPVALLWMRFPTTSTSFFARPKSEEERQGVTLAVSGQVAPTGLKFGLVDRCRSGAPKRV